jgi:hypothetical protein
LLFGHVEIVLPSLQHKKREPKRGLDVSDDGRSLGVAAEFELRLFCARKHKIIACIGEPLFVRVEQWIAPPSVSTLQVVCEGRRALLRWQLLEPDLPEPEGALEAPIAELLRLHMRGPNLDQQVMIDADETERMVPNLTPGAEYRFQIRAENRTGHGREAIAICRVNSQCSAPTGLLCKAAGTTQVQLQWRSPDDVGNKATKDQYQERAESIRGFQAVLRVEGFGCDSLWNQAKEKIATTPSWKSTATAARKRAAAEEAAGPLYDEDSPDEAAGTRCPDRQCRWSPESVRHMADGTAAAALCGLRPNTRYILSGF